MSITYEFMVAGHLCLDIIPRFPGNLGKDLGAILRPGKLVNVEEAAISTGGPVSNTGLNLKRLGGKVCFCARVGDDALGHMALELLRASGNAEGVKSLTGMASSYTVVIAPSGIDRIFLHNPGTNNTFGPEDLDPALIAQCRHFHFGYPPLMRRMFEDEGEELSRIFQIARQAGVTTSCDMTLPDPQSASGQVNWLNILEKTLPYVDLFLPSIEETFYMVDPAGFLEMKRRHHNAELIDHLSPADYSRIADRVLAMGTKAVSLKSGHRGFYLKTAGREVLANIASAFNGNLENWAGRELWAPAFQVEHFGSATGSGDSSIAGLLSAFVRGLPIEQALKYATGLGWQNVQVLDAVSGIKPWEETTDLLAQNLPLIDAHIDDDDWKWSAAAGLWAGPRDPLRD